MMNQNWGGPMGACCPTCGCAMPTGQHMGVGAWPGNFNFGMASFPPGVGNWGTQPAWSVTFAPTTWGGTYAPTDVDYWATAPADDEQLREMIYQQFSADPTIPSNADIKVEVTGGIVTLTGTVPNKRVKHAAGDDAWWIPSVVDVNNQLDVRGRRERMREGRR